MKQTSTLDRTSLRARALEASRIREIAERGMRMPGAIALWFGEGAWSTPAPIVQAAIASLVAGNHMYQPNNGASALRAEICAYANRLYGCALTPDRVTVTQSGTQALALAAQLLVSPGDRIVAIEPGWPNIAGAFRLAGGAVAPVALAPRDGRWVLDLEALLGQLTPGTGAVVLNSPNNPTGWTMPGDEQRALLEHCRARGIWVVTDDVYARLYRHGRAAPSFLEIAHPEDLLISVNSFSKCWSMPPRAPRRRGCAAIQGEGWVAGGREIPLVPNRRASAVSRNAPPPRFHPGRMGSPRRSRSCRPRSPARYWRRCGLPAPRRAGSDRR